MTVLEVGERALSFIPDNLQENGDIKKYFVKWTNQLLADTLNNENAFREASGLKPLKFAPFVKDVSDEIPYNEAMVAAAFPYGMARWIFRDEDDASASQEYYAYYANALAEYTPAVITEFKSNYL